MLFRKLFEYIKCNIRIFGSINLQYLLSGYYKNINWYFQYQHNRVISVTSSQTTQNNPPKAWKPVKTTMTLLHTLVVLFYSAWRHTSDPITLIFTVNIMNWFSRKSMFWSVTLYKLTTRQQLFKYIRHLPVWLI